MYPNLKLQIFKLGLHQNHLAREIGIADTILSKIIHGFREPTADQRRLLARHLGVEEDWLFQKFEATSGRDGSTRRAGMGQE